MPDSVPNYLTTDANGDVGAVFTGRIEAAGIDFDFDPNPGATDRNSITWHWANGGMLARLASYNDGPPDRATSRWEVAQDVGFGDAFLEIQTGNTVGPFGIARVGVGGLGATILDTDGESSFLRWAAAVGSSPGQWMIGTTIVATPAMAAGGFGTTAAINHQLGNTPGWADFMIVNGGALLFNIFPLSINRGVATMTFNLFNGSGGPLGAGSVAISWIAFR